MLKMMMSSNIKRVCAVILVALVMVLVPKPVLASVNPINISFSNFTVTEAKVFGGVVENGDVLILYKYNIGYSTDSYYSGLDDMSYYITFRLVDDNNTLIGTSNPPDFDNVSSYTPARGWGLGVGSFYFTADQASASNINSEADLSIVLSVYPGMSTVTINPYTYTLTSNQWTVSGDTSTSKSAVSQYIITLAQSLASQFGLEMTGVVNGQDVLSSTGRNYFFKVLPGLIYMVVDILGDYTTNVDKPDIVASSDTLVGTSLLDEWDAQWDGTWVKDSLQAIGDLCGGMSWKMVTSLFFLIVWIVLAAFSQIKWGTTDPALWGGMCAASFGLCLGVMEYSVLGVIALLFIFYSAYIVFWRQG